ncbi:MAG: T9SS type A sorting domain-containing protein [Saprospiraceae bacterium]|jgi:hypothetical protein|nr:T9SS type A sorting domain-containing protein [Saprospiraceae bacterium]
MKRIFLVVVAGFFATAHLTAQGKHDYIWLLGQYKYEPNDLFGGSMLDFRQDPVSVSYFDLPPGFDFDEISMVSDSAGNLQMYTDGCRLANFQHQLFEQGDTINPGPIYNSYCYITGYPSTQSSIMLPLPGSPSEYWMFHLGVAGNQYTQYFHCTKVDMALNNGSGQILEKNQLVFDTLHFGEQMTACRHANGRDWWLVLPYGTVQQPAANRYFKFLFTPQGLQGPFRQDIGDGWGFEYWSGQATFSPDGNKYARLNPAQGMRLFDFDRCSGQFLNPRAIYFPNDTLTSCGLAFSPDSRFLYASLGTSVVQYDTEAADVEASRVTVAVYDGFLSPFPTTFYQQMLAPDGRIYITVPSSADVLHVINRPNEKGLACDLVQHGLPIPAIHDWNIPNFPHFRLYGQPGSPCDSLGLTDAKEAVPTGAGFSLAPNPARDRTWVNFEKPFTGWVELIGTDGRVLVSKNVDGPSTAIDLDTSHLAPGLYFVRAKSRDESQYRYGRLVVAK